MADCQLTERQWWMLQSIIDGLRDNRVKKEWLLAYGGDEILGIFGLDDDGELWRTVWNGVTHADFDDFIECGFFRPTQRDRYGIQVGYTLHEQRIIEAVEQHFASNTTPTESQHKPKVFLSYAREDRETVSQIYRYLKDNNCDPWMDVEDLLPGQDWEYEIEKAAEDSDYFLACLSTNSIDKRGYVQKELKKGLELLQQFPEGKSFLIPVKLEEVDVPRSLKRHHWLNWFDINSRNKLLKAIGAVQPETPPVTPTLIEKREDLIAAMGSEVSDVAKRATEELRRYGWLLDGTLRGKQFWKAGLEGTTLDNADLQEAELPAANLHKASLLDVNLRGAWLSTANLQEVNAWRSNLENASLMEADLRNAVLIGANLEGANLRDANLLGANLNLARFNENTILPDDTHWSSTTDMARFTDPNHPKLWQPKS